MDGEIWKDVPGYADLYQVSNLGRVRSLGRWSRNGPRSVYWRQGKVIRPHHQSRGYLYVSLWKDGVREQVHVGRLVGLLFCDNPDGKPEINHENRDKHDNTAGNLTWMTTVENGRHRADTQARVECDIPL